MDDEGKDSTLGGISQALNIIRMEFPKEVMVPPAIQQHNFAFGFLMIMYPQGLNL